MTDERKINFGELLNESLALAGRYPRQALAYVAATTGIIAGFELFDPASAYWPEIAGEFFAGYFLLEAVLRDQGVRRELAQGLALPAYFGVWCMTWLGIWLGLIALVLPGLILASRWLIALPLTIAGKNAVFEAMKQSWEATRRSQWALVGFLALYFGARLVLNSGSGGFSGLHDGAITPPDVFRAISAVVALTIANGLAVIAIFASAAAFLHLSESEPGLDTVFS